MPLKYTAAANVLTADSDSTTMNDTYCLGFEVDVSTPAAPACK